MFKLKTICSYKEYILLKFPKRFW